MDGVDDLQFALETSDLATELALAHFESEISARLQDDGTPVTEADRAVECLLRERLAVAPAKMRSSASNLFSSVV